MELIGALLGFFIGLFVQGFILMGKLFLALICAIPIYVYLAVIGFFVLKYLIRKIF